MVMIYLLAISAYTVFSIASRISRSAGNPARLSKTSMTIR